MHIMLSSNISFLIGPPNMMLILNAKSVPECDPVAYFLTESGSLIAMGHAGLVMTLALERDLSN
jgi:hypothetical protein